MPYLLDKTPISFRTRPILFIDLEFTGLDPNVHEIVEIAALIVSQPNFEITNSYYTKVTPEHIETADPKALRIISYSPQSWSGSISLSQALTEVSALAPDCLLAGWGVQNEWDFLNANLSRLNLPYFYSHHLLEISTLAFVKLYLDPQVQFLNLRRVAEYFKIPLDNHKPDSDIRATYEIFKKLTQF